MGVKKTAVVATAATFMGLLLKLDKQMAEMTLLDCLLGLTDALCADGADSLKLYTQQDHHNSLLTVIWSDNYVSLTITSQQSGQIQIKSKA